MIIKAFSEYIKQFDDDIPTRELLSGWLNSKLTKIPEDHVDKIIHEEIALLCDEDCNISFTGKSPTGKKLLEALYNFADSYEQQKFTRWVHTLKASDFKDFIK